MNENPIPVDDPTDSQFRNHLESLGYSKEIQEMVLSLRQRAFGGKS